MRRTNKLKKAATIAMTAAVIGSTFLSAANINAAENLSIQTLADESARSIERTVDFQKIFEGEDLANLTEYTIYDEQGNVFYSAAYNPDEVVTLSFELDKKYQFVGTFAPSELHDSDLSVASNTAIYANLGNYSDTFCISLDDTDNSSFYRLGQEELHKVPELEEGPHTLYGGTVSSNNLSLGSGGTMGSIYSFDYDTDYSLVKVNLHDIFPDDINADGTYNHGESTLADEPYLAHAPFGASTINGYKHNIALFVKSGSVITTVVPDSEGYAYVYVNRALGSFNARVSLDCNFSNSMAAGVHTLGSYTFYGTEVTVEYTLTMVPVEEEPDTPVVDEPVVDEPTVDEPTVDEPVTDEPASEEPAGEVAADTTVVESVVTDIVAVNPEAEVAADTSVQTGDHAQSTLWILSSLSAVLAGLAVMASKFAKKKN